MEQEKANRLEAVERVLTASINRLEAGATSDIDNRMQELFSAYDEGVKAGEAKGGYRAGFAAGQAATSKTIAGLQAEVAALGKPSEASEISSVSCSLCGGLCVEFVVPNDVWNQVVRVDGKESDKEYLCWSCFIDCVSRFVREHAALKATVDKCRAAGFIDDAGNVRKVLGVLPLTGDGCVVGSGAELFRTDGGGHPCPDGHAKIYVQDTTSYPESHWYLGEWYSTREMAESARRHA